MIELKTKGVAVVDLEEYESLKKFKEEIERGMVGYSKYSLYDGQMHYGFLSLEHALESVGQINYELEKKYNHAEHRFKKIRDTYVEITKMSVWQFLKWRKSPKITNEFEVV